VTIIKRDDKYFEVLEIEREVTIKSIEEELDSLNKQKTSVEAKIELWTAKKEEALKL